MAERLNLQVEAGIGALMTQLANGERRRGHWLSNLVRAMHEQESQMLTSDLEIIKLGFAGLIGQYKQLDARLAQVELQLAVQAATSADGRVADKGA